MLAIFNKPRKDKFTMIEFYNEGSLHAVIVNGGPGGRITLSSEEYTELLKEEVRVKPPTGQQILYSATFQNKIKQLDSNPPPLEQLDIRAPKHRNPNHHMTKRKS